MSHRSFLLAAAALAAGGAPAPALAKVRVVATVPDLGAIARAVGGDHVEVTALASPDQDPHFVDAKPSLLLPLAAADLLIVNGAGLETGWLPPLQVGARNPRIRTGAPGYLDASAAVALKDEGPADRSRGDVHPAGNPHFLYDPRAGAAVARAIGERLAAIDPARGDDYRTGAAALSGSLLGLYREQRDRFAALPDDERRVVSYHNSFPYLYEWLGLREVATVEPLPGIPPDPGHVAGVLRAMRGHGARAIVQEKFYPRRASETLAKLAGARLVVLPAATRFERGQGYLDHLRGLADALYDALAR